jgi:small multidrug resistance pump
VDVLNQGWLFLTVAIACEILATSALKTSEGMTRPLPSLFALAGYGVSFYCLARALQTIPLGVSYAIWSGVGIVALSLIGVFVYRQTLGTAELIGTGLILAGVLVLYGSGTSAAAP